jgi:Got1/Sft2-like family
MSHDFNTGSSSSSSYFDSSFDYRSLLPQGMGGNSGSNNNNSLRDGFLQSGDDNNDIETGGGTVSSRFSRKLTNCLEVCGSYLPEMTWKERMIGCCTCMIAGYLLSLGSFFRIRDLLFGNPVPLVVNSTVGNLIALAGSCFLSGPTNQISRMWTPKRRTATMLYLGSVALTIVFLMVPVFKLKGFILLLLMLSQYVSITWYCLSYIPMGQEMVASYFKRWVTITVHGNDSEY